MKYDELAFFNQQLAAMLRDGIPLEGALKRLCEEMRRGQIRDEWQSLESDLSRGTPLAEALKPRRLPELYKRMVLVGVKSGDLPGALTMLADYFQQQSNLWARLKGLMAYPLIVLFLAFVMSFFLAFILDHYIWKNLLFLAGQANAAPVVVGLWMSPLFIGVALVAACVAAAVSPARRKLRWRLPAFREASVAQISSIIALMLKNGVPLDEALALVAELEQGTRAGDELARWRHNLTVGRGKFSEIAEVNLASSGHAFPPLFVWTVAQSGEDVASGFQKAAELYRNRATYRSELLLYSALPCSILLLAAMIISQIQPVFAALISFIRALSGSD